MSKDHNKKAFLLPDSETSCAMYHAKTENGCKSYKLTIGDCNGRIRLWGPLETDEDIRLANKKLLAMIKGIEELRRHILLNTQ